MPIIINNNIEKVAVKPIVVPVVQKTGTTPKPVVNTSTNSHVLIVNGKTKQVSKHSAYILDMLTIE